MGNINFNFLIKHKDHMARNVTTEWEDLQVKNGAWKAREHVDPTSEEIFQT